MTITITIILCIVSFILGIKTEYWIIDKYIEYHTKNKEQHK